MKILVVGSGGREHALVWKLAQSKRVDGLYCAPGNAGIADLAQCVPIRADDVEGLVEFVRRESIDLTVVGPEAPLAKGIVDSFKRLGLRIFGPTKEAASLESSKIFAKEFCARYNIPQAQFEIFSDATAAKDYVRRQDFPLVVKADGLAAGKGAVICKTLEQACDTIDEMMVALKFGEAGRRVVVEEFLEGEEASFIAICDGNHVLPLASSQDHKAAFDGDRGPNTGGMGAISPAKVVTQEISWQVMERIMLPAARGMVTEGMPFVGALYAGLMMKDGSPKVLEFNVRFGDPETQPLLMRLKDDLVDIIDATLAGTLHEISLNWDRRPAVCVVMASGGYPGDYEKGKVITGLDRASVLEDVAVFHAGTARQGENMVTSGGRVLGVTALGDSMPNAIRRAYDAVEQITWEGAHYRKDIGHKAL
jgi:phosphoribosylamine--glycine ligase